MKKSIQLGWMLLLSILITFSACKDDTTGSTGTEFKKTSEYSNEVPLRWNNFLLEIERFTPGYRPPVSGRAFAYIGLAVYESAIPGMPDNRSFGDYFAGLSLPDAETGVEYHYPTAVNAAYAYMFTHFFPTAPSAQAAKVVALESDFNSQFQNEVSTEVFERSRAWGRAVAQAVYQWSQTDTNGHDAFLNPQPVSYAPPTGPGKWQPTFPDYARALLPYWGSVRTFAASSDDKCPDPLPYSTDPSSEFFVQALETENKVNLIKSGQNYEDRWIADFWSDDCAALTFTPAGRWIAVANQLVDAEQVKLDKAVVVYAKMGMALCDAGVRAWGEKYRFNLLRPVDYIRLVMGHTEWNSIMCPDGTGQYYTPPFPAYPSGHATFSAVAAEVLTSEFGYNHPMVDKCHLGRTEFIGTPRSFDSFYDMAFENAYSRLPIGVHYRMDAEAGLDLGYRIGRKVNSLPWNK